VFIDSNKGCFFGKTEILEIKKPDNFTSSGLVFAFFILKKKCLII
jgi:hypothetical protein